jgi:hypothetical protein
MMPSVANPTAGQAPMLDAPSAVEFMREALIKISEDEIGTIAREVAQKRERLRPLLSADALGNADAAEIRLLLRSFFATRRKADAILESTEASVLSEAFQALLHGDGPLGDRFTKFDLELAEVQPATRHELGGDLLKTLAPESSWLWPRWMWSPNSDTGALPLVLVGDYDLHGANGGETYLKVGLATDAVLTLADELGFSRMRANPFSVDVYLGGVYGVYMYTVTRLRMTQEFNAVIPKLPELLRRLFGVYHPED